MAHTGKSNKGRLKNGKRAGLTRNQQRKLDYAAEAAKSAKGSGQAVSVGAVAARLSKGAKRTNHSPGPGKNGAQHGSEKVWAKQRRKAAEARNQAWAKLSPKEKLASLDERLGKGLGAQKQRARILAEIEAEKPAKAAPKVKGKPTK